MASPEQDDTVLAHLQDVTGVGLRGGSDNIQHQNGFET
jgi:hypothetical protein